eukprot:746356-Hanusia_phi.AAC.4
MLRILSAVDSLPELIQTSLGTSSDSARRLLGSDGGKLARPPLELSPHNRPLARGIRAVPSWRPVAQADRGADGAAGEQPDVLERHVPDRNAVDRQEGAPLLDSSEHARSSRHHSGDVVEAVDIHLQRAPQPDHASIFLLPEDRRVGEGGRRVFLELQPHGRQRPPLHGLRDLVDGRGCGPRLLEGVYDLAASPLFPLQDFSHLLAVDALRLLVLLLVNGLLEHQPRVVQCPRVVAATHLSRNKQEPACRLKHDGKADVETDEGMLRTNDKEGKRSR